jgi:hypothetical protein
MGIYDSGKIFGIKMYLDEDILFEKTYTLMTSEEKKKAYTFYTLNKTTEIFYYTECSSTYGGKSFLMWYPMSLNLFLEKFGK